jgi:hypothetical protein
MTRRLLGIAACGLLLCLGCNFFSPPGTTEPALEETAPIVDHRSTDPATVQQRMFRLLKADGDVTTINGQHNEYVQEFIASSNFGAARMVIRMPLSPIWLEYVLVQPQSDNNTAIPVTSVDYNSGLIRLANQRIVQGTSRKWVLNQHQLVTTNTAAGAAAYTMTTNYLHEVMKSDNPFDGSKAPKRQLDEFELSALERIRNGADVVSQESGKTLRILGSIKARKDCLSCHTQSKEGDMLGAFTYTLNLIDTQTPDQFTLKNLSGLNEQQVVAIRQIEANSGRFTREPDGKITKLQLYVDPRGTLVKESGGPAVNSSIPITVRQSRNYELASLELFPDLLELDVSGSLVTDAGLDHLKPLTKLKKLIVANTQLTKAGIDEFRKTHTGCVIVGAPVNQLPLPNAPVAP